MIERGSGLRPDAVGRSAAPEWPRALLLASATSAVVLVLYLGLHLVEGYGFAIGPDGPVYTWWTRAAAVLGLDAVAPGRPGVPAAALVLGGMLRIPPLNTIALLGPVLAAACGLAAAAFLDSVARPSAVRAVAACLLAGSFAAYLAGGWLANLAQVILFLAALTAFAVAARSWRGVAAGAVLLGAAGLAHRVFVAVGLLILAGTVASLVPDALRRGRAGARLADTLAARLAAGGLAGGLLAVLGFLALGTTTTVPGDTSQDGFFRRLGLRTLLLDRYRERLAGDASRAAVPLSVGGTLGPLGLARFDPDDATRPPRSYLIGVLASWAAVTVAGIAVLSITGTGPPNRMLVFGFFIPLAAALGVEALTRWAPEGARAFRIAVAAVAVAAFVGVAMVGWYRQSPSFTGDELAAARRAGAVVDRLPTGTPVVVLVDTAEPAAAFHITRFANVIRMGIPPERLPDVRVSVGTPADFLHARPTLTGDREHDLIARTYLREATPARGEAAVMVVEAFNPAAFGATPEGVVAAEGVEVVAGQPAIPASMPAPPPPSALSLPGLAGLAVAALVLLGGLGLGWARWLTPPGEPRAVLSLAPAVGLAVAIVGGFAGDRLAGTAAWPWGPAIAATVGLLGYAAAWSVRRRG